jgi:uncharacterized protein involved in type VI secretion and phage assembly
MIVKGSSDNPGVNLGEIITIKGYGRYRVTHVTHTNTETGVYTNTFEAVDANFDAYPKMDMHNYPTAEVQSATVVENTDPDGLGRVKVQFAWQKELGETTPWIRMMTPHAGADKGFHFIPETGEEVVVNFEGGNAERPFVMGALYTGTAKPDSWQTDANDIKAIRTRSGHTIELDDTQGAEEIRIHDNEGSIITYETHTKSLNIHSSETINITAKNINMQAEENITLQAKGDIDTAAEGNIKTLAQGNIQSQSDGDTEIKSKAALAVEAQSDLTATGQNAIIEGKTGAELNGAQTKVTGPAMTEVSAGIVKIN